MIDRKNYGARLSREGIQLTAYGMLVFFLMVPFEYLLTEIMGFSPLRYVSLGVMALAVADIFMGEGVVRIDKRIVYLVLWLIFAAISVLWAINRKTYNEFFSIYFNNSLMFLVVSLVPFSAKSYRLVEKGFLISTVLLLLYMTFIPDATVESSWQSRLTLSYKGEQLLDQNYLAAIMTMQYGMLLYDVLVEKERNKHRILKLIIVVAILYYVLRTGSRGGLLSMGAVTAICVLMGVRRNALKIILLIVAVALALPTVLSYMPEDLLERFSLKALTGQTTESGSRLEIWAIAWKAIRGGNAVWGYGAGSTMQIIGSSYTKDAVAHNAYLAQLLELGLIGLILFVAFLWNMTREIFRRKYIRLGIAFLGMLVTAMFLDVITTKFFWATMMLLSIRINADREQNARIGEGG